MKLTQDQIRTGLRNLVLDALYKLVCQGRSNAQIAKILKKKRMPPIENDRLNGLRLWFKQRESLHPEKMAGFKKRLLGC